MAVGALGLFEMDVVVGTGGAAGVAEAGAEGLAGSGVAGDAAGVEQRGADGAFGGGGGQALVDRAGGVADFQAQVPEEVEHELDHDQRVGGGVVLSQEQQVDVAERRQHTLAVAAGGDHRQLCRAAWRIAGDGVPAGQGGFLQGVGEQVGDQAVGVGSQLVGGLAAGDAAVLELLADTGLRTNHVTAKYGQRGLAGQAIGAAELQRCQQFGGGLLVKLWNWRRLHRPQSVLGVTDGGSPASASDLR
jgi:hypothetical protein